MRSNYYYPNVKTNEENAGRRIYNSKKRERILIAAVQSMHSRLLWMVGVVCLIALLKHSGAYWGCKEFVEMDFIDRSKDQDQEIRGGCICI